MMMIQDWVAQTTAADVMYSKVVSVWPSHTLAQAASVMIREQVSGLPVVDSTGKCVGVFAISDVLRAEQAVAEERHKFALSEFFKSNLALPESVYAEKLEKVRDKLAPAAEQPVERFMTTDLVSVSVDTSLEVIIKSIVDASLHRVLVLDDDGMLVGIVSTIDVLAALMRASTKVEESCEAKRLREEHHL